MKKLFTILLLLIAVATANSQTIGSDIQYVRSGFSDRESSDVYLGLGTGINNYTGLAGLSLNVRIINNVYIQGGLGISTWGYKRNIGLRFDKSDGKGWSFIAGYTNCSGLNNVELELENSMNFKETVTLDLKSKSALDLKASHKWNSGRKNFFYIDLGYSIPLEETQYRVIYGGSINTASEQVLDILSPGGVIIGLGYMFGL